VPDLTGQNIPMKYVGVVDDRDNEVIQKLATPMSAFVLFRNEGMLLVNEKPYLGLLSSNKAVDLDSRHFCVYQPQEEGATAFSIQPLCTHRNGYAMWILRETDGVQQHVGIVVVPPDEEYLHLCNYFPVSADLEISKTVDVVNQYVEKVGSNRLRVRFHHFEEGLD